MCRRKILVFRQIAGATWMPSGAATARPADPGGNVRPDGSEATADVRGVAGRRSASQGLLGRQLRQLLDVAGEVLGTGEPGPGPRDAGDAGDAAGSRPARVIPRVRCRNPNIATRNPKASRPARPATCRATYNAQRFGPAASEELHTLALLEDLSALLTVHGFPPLRGYVLAELTVCLQRIQAA